MVSVKMCVVVVQINNSFLNCTFVVVVGVTKKLKIIHVSESAFSCNNCRVCMSVGWAVSVICCCCNTCLHVLKYYNNVSIIFIIHVCMYVVVVVSARFSFSVAFFVVDFKLMPLVFMSLFVFSINCRKIL